MSTVDQYPSLAYVIVANGSSTELGSFVSDGGDLNLMHMRFYHKKVGAFSYTIKLVVSGSQGGPALVESDVVSFDNAAIGQTTDDHLVDMTFVFSDKYNLLDNETYYLRAETTGYTRPARPLENTAYLSAVCNWYEPIGGSNSSGVKVAIGVEV